MAKVAAGGATRCCQRGGKLFTFGWSKYGQLEHGDNPHHLTPSPVQALADHTIIQVLLLYYLPGTVLSSKCCTTFRGIVLSPIQVLYYHSSRYCPILQVLHCRHLRVYAIVQY